MFNYIKISPLFFNDKERTSALISVCSLLNVLLPDSQPNKKIYDSFEKLINSINLENWILLYIFFEINWFIYIHFKIKCNGKAINELEKNEAIDKKLLRYLTVKVKNFDLNTNYFSKKEETEKK